MNIQEVASLVSQARPLDVPAWTLGCFHRRSITYATGVEDSRTRVIWIQSHGLTGDIRVPAARPDVSHRAGLSECSRDELVALALAEGGVAQTRWSDGRMSWANWSAMQPYDKWPEPGELRRIGACLVEFAPSGVYVEDWRAQPSSSRLLVGLRLLADGESDGAMTPRDGGLVIAGDHAILTVGRRSALPAEAPLPEQFAAAADPAALARTAFDHQTAYATRAGGAYPVSLSTHPFGWSSLDLDGFEPGAEADQLTQTLRDGGRRLWRIDTLLPDVELGLPTEAADEGLAWLAREASRLSL